MRDIQMQILKITRLQDASTNGKLRCTNQSYMTNNGIKAQMTEQTRDT